MQGGTREEELEARRLYCAQYVKPAATKPSKKARDKKKKRDQMLQSNENKEEIEQALKQDLDYMKNQVEQFEEKHKAVIKPPQVQNMLAFLKTQYLETARLCRSPESMISSCPEFLTFQILNTCFETRKINGGIISVDHLLELLNNKVAVPVSKQLLLDKLESLQSFGIELLSRDNTVVVKTVPNELNMDHLTVMHLTAATPNTKYRVEDVCEATSWAVERAKNALEGLVEIGFMWIDDGPGGERACWHVNLD